MRSQRYRRRDPQDTITPYPDKKESPPQAEIIYQINKISARQGKANQSREASDTAEEIYKIHQFRTRTNPEGN